uniref:Uncharacterized protein n=1 Tax=Magallana gigas TaxID=29159 RepID=K1QHU8_MAGGI
MARLTRLSLLLCVACMSLTFFFGSGLSQMQFGLLCKDYGSFDWRPNTAPPEEPPSQPDDEEPGARGPAHPGDGPLHHRRRSPLSSCPFPNCPERTHKLRNHVTLYHLHTVFRRSVPLGDEATSMRLRVCEWLTDHLIGSWATLTDLVQREPAPRLPPVGRTPPCHAAALEGAGLVSRLSPVLRRAYRALFSDETIAGHPLHHYGLRYLVVPPVPAPTVRGVVVDPPAASNGDATPPRRLLGQPDPRPDDDEASQRRDAPQVGEVPVPEQSENSLVLWEPWHPGAGASFAPNPEYPRPPPGALTGGYV